MGQIAEIKAQVRVVLRAVSGIGKVADRVGDSATWIDRPRPKLAYWEVQDTRIPEEDYTLAPTAHSDHTVQVEGWMPFDYRNDSEGTWDALIDAVRDAMRNEETLNGAANETGNPTVTTNDFIAFDDGKAREIVCHHCVIEWRVGRDERYVRS